MGERFVIDGQAAHEQPVGSIVALSLQGQAAGLFRIKQVRREGLLLSHGPRSFPVGTQLDIDQLIDVEGMEREVPAAQHSARVIANDPRGLALSWSTNTRFLRQSGQAEKA